MCVPIEFVHRNSSQVITHVGGSDPWGGKPWGLRVDEAADLIERKLYGFYTTVATPARVIAKVSSAGNKFLTTSPDGSRPNNLDLLPDIPNPIAGVEPQFPLSLPGWPTTDASKIASLEYASGPGQRSAIGQQLGTDKEHVQSVPASFFGAQRRTLYLNAIVPFPAEYRVVFPDRPVDPERWPKRISSNDIASQRDLEAKRLGWWAYDLVLTRPDGSIDPSKPTRLTEVSFIVRLPPFLQSQDDDTVVLYIHSINPNCHGAWAKIKFRLKSSSAGAAAVPADVTLPDVVGLPLDQALNALWDLGLVVYHNGPVAASKDLKVDSQIPAAGTSVKPGSNVAVYTSYAVKPKGTNKITANNASSLGKSLDIWIFNYSTGAWSKEATVPYQAQKDVALPDGKWVRTFAVDTTHPSCRSGKADENACVYGWAGPFLGDSSGQPYIWPIL